MKAGAVLGGSAAEIYCGGNGVPGTAGIALLGSEKGRGFASGGRFTTTIFLRVSTPKKVFLQKEEREQNKSFRRNNLLQSTGST